MDIALATGWTPDTVETVTALGAHAITFQTGLCRKRRRGLKVDPIREPRDAGAELSWLGPPLASERLPVAEALNWLTVVASSPDSGAGDRLFAMAESLLADELGHWRTAAGDLAPLAWAAGLSPAEAAAQALDGSGLRMLATLRGYRFPGTWTLETTPHIA